jgi:hypothetical protein
MSSLSPARGDVPKWLGIKVPSTLPGKGMCRPPYVGMRRGVGLAERRTRLARIAGMRRGAPPPRGALRRMRRTTWPNSRSSLSGKRDAPLSLLSTSACPSCPSRVELRKPRSLPRIGMRRGTIHARRHRQRLPRLRKGMRRRCSSTTWRRSPRWGWGRPVMGRRRRCFAPGASVLSPRKGMRRKTVLWVCRPCAGDAPAMSGSSHRPLSPRPLWGMSQDVRSATTFAEVLWWPRDEG